MCPPERPGGLPPRPWPIRQNLPGQRWLSYRYNPERPAVVSYVSKGPAVNRALYAYCWHQSDRASSGLEVLSPQPFTEAEIEALQKLRRL